MKCIKLMADYQCYPLWNMPPGEYRDMAPEELPISPSLVSRLYAWARMFDATLNMEDPRESGFHSDGAQAEFKREGYRLAEQLKTELGPEFIVTTHI